MSEQEFKDCVFSFNDYDKDLLSDFFEYWSEPDKKGKMKFEKEDTWELGRRLSRWYKNHLKWNKNETEKANLRQQVQAEFNNRYGSR